MPKFKWQLIICILILCLVIAMPSSALQPAICKKIMDITIEDIRINGKTDYKIKYGENFNVTAIIKWERWHAKSEEDIKRSLDFKLKLKLRNNKTEIHKFANWKLKKIIKNSGPLKFEIEFNINLRNVESDIFDKWLESNKSRWEKAWISIIAIREIFNCTKESEKINLIIYKPIPPPQITVKYNKTKCPEILFDYSINLNELKNYLESTEISKEVKIKNLTLEVYNFSSEKFVSIKTVEVDNKTNVVKWLGVKLTNNNFEKDNFIKKAYGKCRIIINNKTKLNNESKPVITESFKAEVKNVTGRPGENFTYTLKFKSNICEKIKLLIYNHTSKNWDVFEEKVYDEPNEEKELKWVVTLTKHHLNNKNDSKYKFKSTFLESQEYEGPYYEINYSITNYSFSPKTGLYNEKYNIKFDFKSDKRVKIRLILETPNKKKKYTEEKIYEKIGDWQTFSWNESFPKDVGNTKIHIEVFNEKNKLVGYETKKGPYIGFAEFLNATVKPKIGTLDTTFKYCVDCRAVKSDFVYLKIYLPNGEEKTIRSKSKTTNKFKTFCFEYRFPDNTKTGNTSFKFFTLNTYSEEYKGPMIKSIKNSVEDVFSNASVSPSVGYYKDNFTFSVKVAEIDGKVDLYILNFTSNRFEKVNVEPEKNGQILSWEVNLGKIYKEPVDGLEKFRFVYNNTISSEEYYGPVLLNNTTNNKTIIINNTNTIYRSGGGGRGSISVPLENKINFNNATVWYDKNNNNIQDPGESAIGTYNTNFTFSVESNADKVKLLIYDISLNKWKEFDNTYKYYLKNKNKFIWKNISVCRFDTEGLSKFKFIGYIGGTKKSSQIFFGPSIKRFIDEEWAKATPPSKKPLNKPEINLTIMPKDKGTVRYFEEYVFTIKVKHPDDANMSILLFAFKPGSKTWRLIEFTRYNPIINIKSKEYKNHTVTKKIIARIYDKEDVGFDKSKYVFKIWYYDGWNMEKGDNLLFYLPPEFIPQCNQRPKLIAKIEPKIGYPDSNFRLTINGTDKDVQDKIFIKLYYQKISEDGRIEKDTLIKEIKINNGIVQKEIPVKLIDTIEAFEKFKKNWNKSSVNLLYRVSYWDLGMEVEGESPISTETKNVTIKEYNIYIKKIEINGIPVKTKNGVKEIEINYYKPLKFIFKLNTIVNVTESKLEICKNDNCEFVKNAKYAFKPGVIEIYVDRLMSLTPNDMGKKITYRLEWSHEKTTETIVENGTTIKVKRGLETPPPIFATSILLSSISALSLTYYIKRR